MPKKIAVGTMWLPGFHRDAHNDVWWGKGFTEWDNIKDTKPIFEGHVQPVRPIDGYSEIDNVKEILRQFNQAAEFNISVIGCYHYWFEGERLLDVPERLIGGLDELPLDLFLFWANHSWSKAWTNTSGDPSILIEQMYSLPGAREHAIYVSELIFKNFYYRIDGKPVFFIYDGIDIYNKCPDYLDVFRQTVKEETGLELHIVVAIRSEIELKVIGQLPEFYDRLLIFEPSFTLSKLSRKGLLEAAFARMPRLVKGVLVKLYRAFDKSYRLFNYDDISNVEDLACKTHTDKEMLYSVCCGFDNSPRYGARARIFTGFDPSKFKYKFRRIIAYSITNNIDLVMVNALNEWGEGMHLQPCEKHGFSKLESIKEVIDDLHE